MTNIICRGLVSRCKVHNHDSPGDLHEFLVAVLLVDCAQLGLGGGHQEGGQLADVGVELGDGVAGVVGQGRRPQLPQTRAGLQQPHGERQGRGRELAGGHRGHGVGAQRQLHDVPRQWR